ncbi:ribosome biogenesis protein SLX9 homolog [Rhineura floridana]|uniref:ribosome biogenesis protein SLX9 homolog n=1 Tax=Rhineura floridana TaxID=261503 RepID=UPI002AC82AF2|nr:ribosome biogenesis protein SLX9 homolog [Rhineura floridana]
MVGKVIKRPRLHRAAPKPAKSRQVLEEAKLPTDALTSRVFTDKDQAFMTSNIFAGVKIDPKSLVKKLDIDTRSIFSVLKGEDDKALLSKKEKMKLRRDRWLQKIENIKLAKEQQKAEAKRKATPVVGDMHPLMDALPELSDLVTVNKSGKQPKGQAKKKVLTNFSQMKSPQKRKVLLEEVAQFHKTISNPLFKASPLRVIGEHLSKRLKLEREGEPF